jgi:DNA-binding transcriptional LysR family regulator
MRTPAESHDLEVRLLRTFLAVVQHGTLGKTAIATKKTQPAISQQMLHLEKVVGQKLFDRGRDRIKLTRHGELLLTFACRLLELNEEALGRLRQDESAERLTLGICPDFALAEVTSAFRQFHSLHPKTELKVIIEPIDVLRNSMKAGKLDLAIAEDSWGSKPVAKCQVALEWVSAVGFEVNATQPIPLVIFEKSCAWRDQQLNSLRSAGLNYRIMFESGSINALIAATQSGLGVGAFSPSSILGSNLVRIQDLCLPSLSRLCFGLFRAPGVPACAHLLLQLLGSAIENKTNASEIITSSWPSPPDSRLAQLACA